MVTVRQLVVSNCNTRHHVCTVIDKETFYRESESKESGSRGESEGQTFTGSWGVVCLPARARHARH